MSGLGLLPKTADVELIRQVVSELTRVPEKPYRPGTAQRPYACPHCGEVYSHSGVRRHIPRCESKPVRRTQIQTRLGAIRLTPARMYQRYAVADWLSIGAQGAD